MNPHRLAATAAAGVLLLTTAAACTDDEPQTGTVGAPTPAEDAGDNNGANDSGDGQTRGGQTGENDPTEYETAEHMPDELLQTEMETFVGEFFTLSDEAMATGDTTPARELVTEECEPCWHQLDYTDSVHEDGNTIKGGEHDAQFSLRIVAIEGDVIETQVEGRYAEFDIVDGDGNLIESHDPVDFWLYLGVDRNEDGSYTITRGRNLT